MGKHFRDQREGKQLLIDAGWWVLVWLVCLSMSTLLSSNNSWPWFCNRGLSADYVKTVVS